MSSKHLTPKQLVTKLLEAFVARDAETIISIYDEAEVIGPFALPKKLVVKNVKRDAAELIRRSTTSISSRMYENIKVKDLTVFETKDPEWVIMEWTYISKVGEEEIENANISVMQVRDGRIIQARDYHNHVARAVAQGHLPEILTTIAQMELEHDREERLKKMHFHLSRDR
jgi:ketosteroid isomerase-like protein